MHLVPPAVLSLAAAALISAQPQRADELVGRWQGSIGQDQTRTDVVLDFFPNGTYARRVSVTTEFGWTQEGDILLLAPAIDKKNNDITYGKATVVSMKLSDDLLTIADAKQSISMKRATAPVNESKLIGRWEGQSEMNEGIIQDFLSDGRLMVTVTLAREAGRYSIKDSKISWEVQIPQPHKTKSRFRMEGNKLMMFLTDDIPALEMTRVEIRPQ
jgi:hypothetical protein